jgi:hypothetical protein
MESLTKEEQEVLKGLIEERIQQKKRNAVDVKVETAFRDYLSSYACRGEILIQEAGFSSRSLQDCRCGLKKGEVLVVGAKTVVETDRFLFKTQEGEWYRGIIQCSLERGMGRVINVKDVWKVHDKDPILF